MIETRSSEGYKINEGILDANKQIMSIPILVFGIV